MHLFGPWAPFGAELDSQKWTIETWTHSNRSVFSVFFMCWGSQSWPLLFWCTGWLSELQVHTVGSCPTLHSQEPPSPSSQGFSQVLLLVSTHVWDCPTIGYPWIYWIPWDSFGLNFQVFPRPIMFFRCVNSNAYRCVICKFVEGAYNLNVFVIDKDVKEHWSQDRPLRDIINHQPLPSLSIFTSESTGFAF